ncbi:protein tyrosine phosphatase [Brachybacterium phenoliresistens]|uniref:protein-tyrosine-phosphatase n=1 Tax=Brachybacterium phenoliresistens TaxID=396014 RepID=Z9JU89_9MICO|nr:low molecular weight phosphatase family protein [Brachybacterium phenoliresistens]EWS81558.1 protein tyrosine phosphatase [Brachybacterium phenoliresistens]
MTEPLTPRSADDPVRSVLFVCTGNVCRSPFAELLLRDRVPGLAVSSRGTYALVGQGMERQMAGQLALLGVGSDGFRSRQLQVEDLSADLVLVMSGRQRNLVLEESPAAARRTGLLGHLPELTAQVGDRPLNRGAVAAWTRASAPAGRDIPDPYRRSEQAAAQSARMIQEHVTALAALLRRSGTEDTAR